MNIFLRMKRYLVILFLLVVPLSLSAQVFEFRREVPRSEERRSPVEYKDGQRGLERFMMEKYDNPDGGRGVNGDIVVEMIVNEKGKVTDTRVLSRVSKAYDDEAERVVRKMKFKPAKVGKKKVKSRTRVVFPIRRGRLSFVTFDTIDI